MTDNELRIKVLLRLQVALLGEIDPSIRGITCGWSKSLITIHCYFQGEINDDNKESMNCVETEIMADFTEHKVNLECKRLDLPTPLNPYTLSAWVYRRKE
jgi:hypothetical protein